MYYKERDLHQEVNACICKERSVWTFSDWNEKRGSNVEESSIRAWRDTETSEERQQISMTLSSGKSTP